MPRAHDYEIRFRAEELYVEDQLTYEEIAEKLGIGSNTVKKWGRAGNWKTLKKERLEARRSLKHNLFKLRQSMITEATESKDPRKVFAAIRLEKLAQDMKRKDQVKEPDIDRPKIFLEDMEFVAETLEEIDPEGLKVLARNFDEIVRRFKEQYAQTA